MSEQRRRYAVIYILLCLLTNTSVGQRAPSASEIPESDALAKTLDELVGNVPKWRVLIAAVDVDALPLQYKVGKVIEQFRTLSLEKLDEIGTLAASLRQKPTTSDSMQLLLDLKDLDCHVDHLATALMLATGPDGTVTGQAVSWSKNLTDQDSSIMKIEKRIEVPVIRMLMARDALTDVCRDKFTH